MYLLSIPLVPLDWFLPTLRQSFFLPPSTKSRRICQPGQQTFFLSLPTTPNKAKKTVIPANFFEMAAALCCLFEYDTGQGLYYPLHGSNCKNPILATSFLHFLQIFLLCPFSTAFFKNAKWKRKKQQTFFRFTASMCRCDGRRIFSFYLLISIWQTEI